MRSSDGEIENIAGVDLRNDQEYGSTIPIEVFVSSGYAAPKLSAIRALLGRLGDAGATVSAWVPVSDPRRPPAASLIVTSLSQSSNAITVDLRLRTRGLGATGGPCASSYNCIVYLQGKRASDGAIVSLTDASANPSSNLNLNSLRVQGTFSTPPLSAVRAVAGPWYDRTSNVVGRWVPVGAEIVGGHDLTAAADMWALAAATSLAPCIERVPAVGPPVAYSSLNAYQVACVTAIQNGMTLKQVFRELIAQFGPSLTTALLVGLQPRLPTTTAHQAPTWPEFAPPAVQPDPATPSTPTTRPRPAAAPPVLDPVFEENITADARPLHKVWGDPAANEEQYRLEVIRQCVAIASLPGATFTPDDCNTKPIFSPGSDVYEAAANDWKAILDRPEWAELDYMSGPEKVGSGVVDRWYRGIDPCTEAAYESGENSCDEYPYYTSVEGGPGARLAMIDKAHNSLEGSYLYAFARVCGLFEPQPTRDRSFLVVPIAIQNGPKSSGWCGVPS